eukprot:919274-Alexandrium_andersonii.AAC.1
MYKIETDAQAADIFAKPFKDVKRWAAVRDLVLVVNVKGFRRCAVSGGGVLPPCPFERIKYARRRSEESGGQNECEQATLHRSEDASPADGGGHGPSDQLSLPSVELESFDIVSKRA